MDKLVLKHQVSSLKTQNSIIEQSKNLEILALEKKIQELNQENQKLATSRDFLYQENEKLNKERDEYKKKSELKERDDGLYEELEDEIASLKETISLQNEEIAALQARENALLEDVEEMVQEEATLESRAKSQLDKLSQENAELLQKLNELHSSSSISEAHPDLDKLKILNENLTHLNTENAKLRDENQEMKIRIENTNADLSLVNILNEEKKSLKSEIDNLKELLSYQSNELQRLIEKNSKLEDETAKQYVLSGKTDTELAKFYSQMSEVEFKRSVQEENIHFLENELKLYKDEARHTKGELEKAHNDRTLINKELESVKSELNGTKNENTLLLMKIDILHKKIDNLSELCDKLMSNHEQNIDIQVQKLDDVFVSGMESKINEIIQEQGSANKKPKLNSSTNDSTNTLAAENKDLKEKMRDLQRELKILQGKTALMSVESLEKRIVQFLQETRPQIQKAKETRILELYHNPMRDYQAIKQESLDRLEKENEELRKSISGSAATVETIPKSVLTRYMTQYEIKEQQLQNMDKRLDRLKKVYNDKSAEFVATVAKIFGFKIEFMMNTKKVKLKSKFSDKETSSYLVIDMENDNLQISSEADEAFKNKCESLISYWVKNRGEIPCFLAALSMELFNS